jgi:TRAP-type mannitol/chloroaromatic compound transport system permease large subunit
MLTSSERTALERAYRGRVDHRAAIAKCAAGLIIVLGIALLGIATPTEEQQLNTASITSRSVAIGR